MDIKKEREAFEAYELLKKPEANRMIMFQRFDIEDLGSDEHSYFGKYYNSLMQEKWELWLEAKQQAVPDGFVVVPVEPTERMLDCAYSSISDNLHYADLENIYRAMTQEFIDD